MTWLKNYEPRQEEEGIHLIASGQSFGEAAKKSITESESNSKSQDSPLDTQPQMGTAIKI